MLRLDYPEIEARQISIIEGLLPPQLLKLPSDLEKVDHTLNDERFEEPFIKKFNVTIGRGSVPIRPYIRLMVLKYSNEWGYETLEKKVNDSITLKKFCRIPFDRKAPDSTTLIKLNHKYGEDIIKELNKLLINKLTERKIIRGRKLRVDTTVVESNIQYPSDASLLKDCVYAVAGAVKKVKSVSKDATKGFRSGTRKIKKQMLKIVKVLRRRNGNKKQEVKQIVDEMVQTTGDSEKAAKKILKKISNKDDSKSIKAVKQLEELLEVTREVIEQTKEVQSGNMHIKNRIVSIHDKDARPIKKGKAGVNAEFGYKVQIEECEKGFVSNYELYKGNPCDDDLIMDAVERHKDTFGKAPDTVTADRGYGRKDNEEKLKEQGVKRLPYQGKERNPKTVKRLKIAGVLKDLKDGEQQ